MTKIQFSILNLKIWDFSFIWLDRQNCTMKIENNLSVLKARELCVGGGKTQLLCLQGIEPEHHGGHFGHRHILMTTYF